MTPEFRTPIPQLPLTGAVPVPSRIDVPGIDRNISREYSLRPRRYRDCVDKSRSAIEQAT